MIFPFANTSEKFRGAQSTNAPPGYAHECSQCDTVLNVTGGGSWTGSQPNQMQCLGKGKVLPELTRQKYSKFQKTLCYPTNFFKIFLSYMGHNITDSSLSICPTGIGHLIDY